MKTLEGNAAAVSMQLTDDRGVAIIIYLYRVVTFGVVDQAQPPVDEDIRPKTQPYDDHQVQEPVFVYALLRRKPCSSCEKYLIPFSFYGSTPHGCDHRILLRVYSNKPFMYSQALLTVDPRAGRRSGFGIC